MRFFLTVQITTTYKAVPALSTRTLTVCPVLDGVSVSPVTPDISSCSLHQSRTDSDPADGAVAAGSPPRLSGLWSSQQLWTKTGWGLQLALVG